MMTGVTMNPMKSAASQASVHPGDLALLRASAVLARGGRGAQEVKDAVGVLRRTLADADWAARGTAGLVPLLGCCAWSWEDDEDNSPGYARVRTVCALVRDFCNARGFRGNALYRALGEGMAAVVAAAREAGGGLDTGRGVDAGEALVLATLSAMPDADRRGCFGHAMAVARTDYDRLALAGAGLVDMECLLPGSDEQPWRPKPACVAWLLAGLACPRAGCNANRIHESACDTPGDWHQPKGGVADGSALEWLLTSLTQMAIAWDDAEVDAFVQADRTAWRTVARLDRRVQRANNGAAAYAGLDDEDIPSVRAALRDALAMRQAKKACARIENGGNGACRHRRLA